MSTTSVSSKLTYERFELIGKRSIGPLDEVIYIPSISSGCDMQFERIVRRKYLLKKLRLKNID